MAVFEKSQSSGNDRLVLLCIADEADDDGRNAFPSIRRLALKANCHTDTVIECIKRLETAGELQVVRPERQGRGRFNRYKVLVGMVGNPDLSAEGSVSGSVTTGLVRTQPRQNDTQPAPKSDGVRPLSGFPQAHECELCTGGWIEDEDRYAVRCPNDC